jgi:exosortase A-associated hydrolase 2
LITAKAQTGTVTETMVNTLAHTKESTFITLAAHNIYLRSRLNARQSQTATLLLSPFAEEMNKSRHLSTQLMNALCQQGQDCFFPDPFGTGDSDADLDVATATLWRQDLLLFIQQLKDWGYQSFNLVAARYGALQLIDLLTTETLPLPLNKIVLWQPYLQSSTFLQQFFRLKIAEQMATGNKTTQKELEQQLSTGEVLEIAGYPITQNFVSSIHALKDVASLPALYQQTPLLWLETSMLPNISPVCEKGMALLSQYFAAEFTQLQGPAWWNATELVQSPELIARSVEFLTGKTA